MMFSIKESKKDSNFEPSLLSNNGLWLKAQQKTSMIGSRKGFDVPLPILTKNIEERSI